MEKFILVARHEYLRLVKRRSFILSTLGFPVLIGIIIAISIIASLGQRGDQPVGYVDSTGILSPNITDSSQIDQQSVIFYGFDTLDAALKELTEERLQAVIILSPEYRQTGKVTLYYTGERPSNLVQADIRTFLKRNLVKDQPTALQTRLLEGPNLVIRSADGSREFDNRNIVVFFIPFISAFLFIIAVMSASGYMLEAVTQEKDNRTIEVLATSVKSGTLIGGKAVGLMGVGLTQLGIWGGTGIIGLMILSQYYEQLKSLRIPWSTLAIVGAFFLPAYALMSGMMTMIGSIVPDSKQGQQISGIVNLLFTSPFFFMTLIMAKPNHPLVVGLSIFPTTAFITITMRWAMTSIPVWQLISSLVVLILFAGVSIWAAARIFRLGMLRYGQRLSFRHIMHALRSKT
jgi:ABC-2 type transport system permease protein